MDKLKYIKLENEDGSFSDAIPLAVDGNYVDMNGETLSNVLANKVDTSTLNNNVNILQNEINSLASGAPKGSYTTVSALITANPDTGVYVVTADGHIYSWTKNGAEAIDLGVYQAILDDSYTRYYQGYENVNLYDNFDLVPGYINSSSGWILSNSSYYTTNYIPVVANENYLLVGQYRKFLAYNSDKQPIASTYEANDVTDYVFTPSTDGYIRATVYTRMKDIPKIYYILKGYDNKADIDFSQIRGCHALEDKAWFSYSEQNYLDKEIKNINDIMDSRSACDGTDMLIEENYEDGHFYIGGIVGSTVTTEYSTTIGAYRIPVAAGDILRLCSHDYKKVYSFVYVDTSDKILSKENVSLPHNTSDGNYYKYETTLYINNNGYILLPWYKNEDTVIAETYCYKITNWAPALSRAQISEMIENAVSQIEPAHDIQELQAEVEALKASNVLWGKKYVACGDSFTEGDFGSYVDPEGKSGKQSDYIYDKTWNVYKTYPYWVAKRNNMTLVNEAKCGTTMTTLERNDAFSINRYKNIPADADYITLKFGINDDDSHQHAPIGTIDDNVATTFYGAWNITMDYIIRNHPYAKIGIIIGNGLNGVETGEPYCEAMRNIAKKWGLPYLDEDLDDQVPLTFRTNKTYVNSDIANFRASAFRVSNSNYHPGLECHKYESTIVEDFLRHL